MQAAYQEFAQLVENRASSLEGQQACHVYVAQELVGDMKDRLERTSIASQLGPICEAAFAEVSWDWTANRATGNNAGNGMLLSAGKIQSALGKIVTWCHQQVDDSSPDGSGLNVGCLSINEDSYQDSPLQAEQSPAELEWTVQQCFPCSADPQDGDFISAVEFDHSGEFIAAATRLGKISVYQQNPDEELRCNDPYRGYCTFQSHTAEFDYLKSLEIEERINSVRWGPRESTDSHLLFATNDKTIRLWKIKAHRGDSGSSWVGKRSKSASPLVKAHPRQVYSNGHIYHINSLSLNSDGETFLTSDDLRINMWHTESNTESFNIVDLKPDNMDDLSEVITSCEFHPDQCNIFIYGSSKGCIRMADMRSAALCDEFTKNFRVTVGGEPRSFFSEIISSISDIKFSNDSRHILSRDFLTLKLWDVRVETQPVYSIPIHDHLRAKLCELYENDGIFDKFECSLSQDGSKVITGSYDHRAYMYDLSGATPQINSMIEGHKVFTAPDTSMCTPNSAIEFENKCLHAVFAPKQDVVALAETSELVICNTQPVAHTCT